MKNWNNESNPGGGLLSNAIMTDIRTMRIIYKYLLIDIVNKYLYIPVGDISVDKIMFSAEKTHVEKVKGLEMSIRDLKKSIHERERQINELEKEKEKNWKKISELSAEKENLKRELHEKEEEKARLIKTAHNKMMEFGTKLSEMYADEFALQLADLDGSH